MSDYRALAASLAQQFASRAAEADRVGVMPPADVAALRTSGYLALPVPLEYGGGGGGLADAVAAHIELSKGSASTAMLAAMTLQTLGSALENGAWSPRHREEFCHAVVQEGALFNAVATEPALGSPSRGQAFATYAELGDDGHYRIYGHKSWITGGQHLTHLLVKLRLGDETGVLLVHQGAEGLRWENTWRDSLSLRASDSHDVYFEGVRVPPQDVVEQGKKAEKHPNGWFPMLVACVYLGTAWAARDALIRFALERVPTVLGKPIATLPKIQRQIGEADTLLQAAQALMENSAKAWQETPPARASLYPRLVAAKHFAVEAALQATEITLKAAGGSAITHDLPLERFFRDVRAGSMQPPSGDTALEIVGRSALEAAHPQMI